MASMSHSVQADLFCHLALPIMNWTMNEDGIELGKLALRIDKKRPVFAGDHVYRESVQSGEGKLQNWARRRAQPFDTAGSNRELCWGLRIHAQAMEKAAGDVLTAVIHLGASVLVGERRSVQLG